MRKPAEPAALADIAADAGLSLSDVAFTAGLDESTISRLWTDPGWLDRVTGSSLQRMIASVPGVAEYVTAYSLASRLSRLAAELADDAKVASYLARFWGRDQDRALERLFSDGEDRLLIRPGRLLSASAELAPRLRRPAYSFHAILAGAVLAHHATRTAPDALNLAPSLDRQEAMSLRSNVMGVLIGHDDFDLALRYGRMVAKSPVLTVVEDWAFPTYTRDVRPEPGFTLPRSLLLRNTAAEVVREIGCYGGAYVHYLLSVYLPRALARDPTFGLALPALGAAIRQRLDRDGDPALRAVCGRTLRDLGGVS